VLSRHHHALGRIGMAVAAGGQNAGLSGNRGCGAGWVRVNARGAVV